MLTYFYLTLAAGNAIFGLMEVVDWLRGEKPDGNTRWFAIFGAVALTTNCLNAAWP